MREYDESFVARVKDLAVIGLYPTQIAERLGLVGEDRHMFLCDIADPDHPLSREYYKSRENFEADLEAALAAAVGKGDPFALQVALNARHQREVDSLTYDLFGI